MQMNTNKKRSCEVDSTYVAEAAVLVKMSSNGGGSGGERPYNYKEIYDLIDRLTISIAGRNTTAPYKDIVRNVAQYVSNSPTALGKALPYDSTTLETKIRQHINKTLPGPVEPSAYTSSFLTGSLGIRLTGPRFAGPGTMTNVGLFQKMNEQLKCSRLDSHTHRSLLTFLLFMANSNTKDNNENSKNKVKSSTPESSPVKRFANPSLQPTQKRDIHTQCLSANAEHGKMDIELPEPAIIRSIPLDAYKKSTTIREGTSHDFGDTESSVFSNYDSNKQLALPTALQTQEPQNNLNDDIVQNLIYAFTGIEGKYLQKDIQLERFKLKKICNSISKEKAHIVLFLSHLGYYHNLLQNYINPSTGKTALGYMGQGFISALRNELTKYYGMVAMLQEQLNEQQNLAKSGAYPAQNRLTLTKLLVWSAEPLQRLKCLTIIAEKCKVQKGGELASTVYSFLGHGNPMVKSLAKSLLLAVCHPLYQMLTRWLLEGEIADPHNEFFIKCVKDVGPERLWQEKYGVCTDMLPSFISIELANKILITGKSINFLREVCEDKRLVKGRDELLKCIEENGEQIFAQVADTKLHGIIETIFEKTSKRVLDKVKDEYKLEYHLQAMRRYLLLGQGDFIGVLIELLKTELYKPAKDLRLCDLSCILDAAIRSTNAQYDGTDIYNTLDVQCNNACDGDIGWDIVALLYKLQGPLAILLEESTKAYQLLFRPLWRMKHMEHMLSTKIWKDQKCYDKTIKPIAPEIGKVLYQLHMLTSEIMHFIHQMEYYILFEVIECSWSVLIERIKQAKTLDDVLGAHNLFLAEIKKGAFQDNTDGNSQELCQNMETVYECIQRLEMWQDKFYDLVFKELHARKKYTKEITVSEKKGVFGTSNEKKLERDQERKLFDQHVVSYHKSLENISADYEKAVRCFLLSLHSNNDHNLQLFGIRLDFNEYYKKRDQRIGAPLTFEHMRMSNIMLNNKSTLGTRYPQLN